MPVIGMFHFRKDPKRVGRAYRFASIASLENIDFFYFTSKRVDFDRKIIKGLVYKNNTWQEKEFNFPDCIINHVGPITKKQAEIYYKLKKEISFTSNPVGTKLTVYNKIKKGKEFSYNLIPYKLFKNTLDVFEFLNLYNKIILKPISGHHGNKIISIEQLDDKYEIKENKVIKYLNKLELISYLDNLKAEQKMIIQKYIKCRTKDGDPFDIRLHLHKDENGNWKNTLIYPKIGYKENVATNLGQGGKITLIKNFLKINYGDGYFDLLKYLEVFAIQFANHFCTLYNHDFDELGIDLGIDENRKVWIYEVNWRPGQIFLESKSAVNAMRYANFLAKKAKNNENINVK